LTQNRKNPEMTVIVRGKNRILTQNRKKKVIVRGKNRILTQNRKNPEMTVPISNSDINGHAKTGTNAKFVPLQ